MASILQLAVSIADVIRRAAKEHARVVVEDRADERIHSHPEAEVTHKEPVEAPIMESS
jgi:hypothetical protein